MSVAGLRGVQCMPCAQQGHGCQAQIWIDGEPLCMRCADGEPCCWRTAKQIEAPAWRREAEEVFGVPACRAVAPCVTRSERVRPPKFTQVEMEEIRAELVHVAPEKVALRHGLDPAMLDKFAAREKVLRPRREQGERERGVDGRQANMAKVQALVAKHFGLKREDLLDASHSREFAVPRQIAMFLIVRTMRTSLPAIGAAFGRHHTTVLYSYRTVRERIKTDNGLKCTVQALGAQLGPEVRRF